MESLAENISRRQFCQQLIRLLPATALAPWILSCDNPVISEPPEPDIELTGNNTTNIALLKNQFTTLQDLASDASQKYVIEIPSNGSRDYLTLQIIKNRAADYCHLRIKRYTDGEVVNVLWGQDGIFPSIKLTDDRGNTLVKNEHPLEFSFNLVNDSESGSIGWLKRGIKILAIALAVWLGAKVVGWIVAAVAFLAFNAMVIGLVIAGVTVLAGLLKWLAELTGWTIEDITELLGRAAEELLAFFDEIVANLV